MKKLITTILILALALSLGTMAFADNSAVLEAANNGTDSEDIVVNYDAQLEAADKEYAKGDSYYVVINWTVQNGSYFIKNNKYTYNAETGKVTKDDEHFGEVDTEKANTTAYADITIENRSQSAIEYTISFAAETSVYASMTEKNDTLAGVQFTDDVTDPTVDQKTENCRIDVTKLPGETSGAKLGTLTVTIGYDN